MTLRTTRCLRNLIVPALFLAGPSMSAGFPGQSMDADVSTSASMEASASVAGQGTFGDLDGDRRADALWRNSADGEIFCWLLNGSTIAAVVPLPQVADLNWEIKARGDFNGDGTTDLFWRNKTTGQTILWFMSGGGIASWANSIQVSDLTWDIVGAGDLDGDGKADVLWRNAVTGDTISWFMNGANVANWAFLPSIGVNWQVARLADLDGDGRADIVWRNTVTGENTVWLMNGATIVGSAALPTTDPALEISSVADLDGDGRADILWHDNATTQSVVWFMNGTQVASTATIYVHPVDDNLRNLVHWEIRMVADVNADGKADILWRNNLTGETILWLMNGASVTSSTPLPTVSDLNFTLVRP